MTPETALRMRVLLEALCAALTGMFPWSRRLKAAFASAFAWLDQMAIAAVPVVVVVAAADAAGPVVRVRRVGARAARGARQERRVVAVVVARDSGFMPSWCAVSRASLGVGAGSVVHPSGPIFAKI